MNKKIMMSVSVIVASAAVIIGGTTAFFSDTETSVGNTFTAGAIDLKVDSEQHYNNMVCTLGGPDGFGGTKPSTWQPEEGFNYEPGHYPRIGDPCDGTWTETDLGITNKFFDFADVKPGDEGENTISLHVINNDAYVCATVSNLANDDLGLTEPEQAVPASDSTNGAGNGELQQNLIMTVWNDNGAGAGGIEGDNVKQTGEPLLYTGAPQDGTWALYDSTTGTPLSGGSTGYLGVAWSLPLATGNEVQTDSLTGDISFSVVQSRNNSSFKCSDGQSVIVNANDLAQSFGDVVTSPSKWLFYNDTNDTVMTINQFSGDGGTNDIVAGPDSVGAAQMTLHEASARYNIATYKYNDVKLSDINSLKYRIYDASASAETPYLQFNVDFNNSNVWQSRLLMTPVGVSVNTWTTVDAIAGGTAVWHWSGFAKGPDGVTGGGDDNTWPIGAGGFDETVANHTWAEILAAYPSAETRSTDSWLGVRVGHPGPDNETGFVDWIEFDGETTDFEN